MASELLTLAAITAALVGASLSVVKGWLNAPPAENFSHKKLISALITSGFAVFGISATLPITTDLPTMGIVGFLISCLVLGWGVDKGLSGLDK